MYIFYFLHLGDIVPVSDGSDTNPNRKGRPKGRGRAINIRPPRKTFTVAASVKTGLGFSEFLETLESALSLLLKPISVFVPVSTISFILYVLFCFIYCFVFFCIVICFLELCVAVYQIVLNHPVLLYCVY